MPELTVIAGDGSRDADEWDTDHDVTPDTLRETLEQGLADGDRVFVFVFKRGAGQALVQSTVALQRRGLRVTWVEAYGAMMAWLNGWAAKSW